MPCSSLVVYVCSNVALLVLWNRQITIPPTFSLKTIYASFVAYSLDSLSVRIHAKSLWICLYFNLQGWSRQCDKTCSSSVTFTKAMSCIDSSYQCSQICKHSLFLVATSSRSIKSVHQAMQTSLKISSISYFRPAPGSGQSVLRQSRLLLSLGSKSSDGRRKVVYRKWKDGRNDVRVIVRGRISFIDGQAFCKAHWNLKYWKF